jgi:hypothetical protein
MRRHVYNDSLDAVRGILVGVALSAVSLVACGIVAKLMWKVFMWGWNLV